MLSRLPYYINRYNNYELVYCSNKKQPNEFWGPLLVIMAFKHFNYQSLFIYFFEIKEKAYAKYK